MVVMGCSLHDLLEKKKDDLHDLKIAELFKDQIDGKFAELCFPDSYENLMMMAHSSQTRIVGKVDGQFVHARRWL